MATKQSKAQVPAVQEQFAMTDVPSYISQGGNRGSEDVTTSDMVLPRLEIVQSQSPIKDENPEAQEGLMFNSVTEEIYGDLVYFVPVKFRMEYLVWRLKDEGGGFFGSFPTRGEAEARAREVIADGNDPEHIEVVDTPVQYGLRVRPDGTWEQLVVSMAKSKAKVSRKWNSLIQIAGGDRFSRVYKLTTFKDENQKGQKFQNFIVGFAGFPPEPVYRAAEQLYKFFQDNNVRAAHETVVEGGEGTGDGVDREGI